MEEHITIDRSNFKATDGQKVQAYGIIVDRSRSKVITAVIRKPKHVNGLHINLKADKIQSKSYNAALLNVKYIPGMYTGVPIIGISPSGAKHLQQELKENPPKLQLPLTWKAPICLKDWGNTW
jgi:hypothetical protein